MLKALKRWWLKFSCPHAPAFPPGASAVVKRTIQDEVGGPIRRTALCAICGATWDNIPNWVTFKPSPGRPASGPKK